MCTSDPKSTSYILITCPHKFIANFLPYLKEYALGLRPFSRPNSIPSALGKRFEPSQSRPDRLYGINRKEKDLRHDVLTNQDFSN